MNLPLPSGAVASVEEPRLRAVLIGGGSEAALVEAVWTHDMEAARLTGADRAYLAEWCAVALARDDEADALDALCHRYGCAPSERLRISDPVLAFLADAEFALLDSRAVEQPEEEQESDTAVKFTTPEV